MKNDIKKWIRVVLENQKFDINSASELEQLAAVKQNGIEIHNIKNPSEQVQLAAVKQNIFAIGYIKNPSEQVQLAAVKQNIFAITYIKNPSLLVLNQCKPEIIKSILIDVRDGKILRVSQLFQKLAKTNWPELAIINRSLEYEKNRLNESADEQAQLAAVTKDGLAIRYFKDPSERVQLDAVTQTGNAIGWIKNPSEELQLAAVNQTGYAIQYIKNPSEAVQIAAVKQNVYAIQYIKNPSEAVQIAAVKQDGLAIQLIKHPSIEVLNQCKPEIIKLILIGIKVGNIRAVNDLLQKVAKTNWPELAIINRSIEHEKNRLANRINEGIVKKKLNESNTDEQEQIAAVKQNGNALANIENPSEAVQLAAVKRDGRVILHIKNPSEAEQIAAVKQNVYAIQYIKNPSEAVQLAAVAKRGFAIAWIKNPSEAVQLAAVKQNGNAIQFIKNPSERIQIAAIKQDTDVIRYYIENLSIDVLNQCKDEIIKLILIGFKNNNLILINDLLQKVAKTNWPELAIINRSLEHEKNRLANKINEGIVKTYNSNLDTADEQEQIAAVTEHPLDISKIKNPSDAVQIAAINKMPSVFRYLKNPSERVQIVAVTRDPSNIHKIPNPSNNVIVAVIDSNGHVIEHIPSKLTLDILNQCKRSIIKTILDDFKHEIDGNYYGTKAMIRTLQKHNIDWPELKTIVRSMEYEINKRHSH